MEEITHDLNHNLTLYWGCQNRVSAVHCTEWLEYFGCMTLAVERKGFQQVWQMVCHGLWVCGINSTKEIVQKFKLTFCLAYKVVFYFGEGGNYFIFILYWKTVSKFFYFIREFFYFDIPSKTKFFYFYFIFFRKFCYFYFILCGIPIRENSYILLWNNFI